MNAILSFFKKHKFWRYFVLAAILINALIGFVLTSAFVAMKLHLTDSSGTVDFNDRYFQDIADKYGKSGKTDSATIDFSEAELMHKIMVISHYYPENAVNIFNAYYQTQNLHEAFRMVDAVNLHMADNKPFLQAMNSFNAKKAKSLTNKGSVYEWMNIREWGDFKLAVKKDKHLIDSVAALTGVEPRLIVSVLVGEQIRLFNSSREAYKKWIGPLKILSVETTFSLGVTGIKPFTAQTIERNLKDTASPFYLGPEYEHLLDFKTAAKESERFQRLTSYKDHTYSYMYAALNIKQINKQWERAGFPIDNRPEILATLFNIGFEVSVPKANPVVGGSGINIRNKRYTFGSVAYEFYYSGELFDLFPFWPSRFTRPVQPTLTAKN